MKIILSILVIALLMGCTAPHVDIPAEPQNPTDESQEQTQEAGDEVTIEDDLVEIDSLEEDLNMDDLESISDDLDQIDW